MDTLARMSFVSRLVEHGLLAASDGIDVLNASVQRPGTFLATLAAHGLEVKEQ